ncbi:uracil-DNA glycosylase [Parathielavia appendiculata]|uniref:Uracil-DNA glycosylase n=1 Tax=Parathielavia appendiculata TaxID=2587402 RepID=A0AAN6Z7R5_9PEZI|nr:uracil-DNA glycosylase [Parathielavia appendiculata]
MSTLKRKSAAEAGAEPKKAKQGNIMSFFGTPKPSATSGSASGSNSAAAVAPASEPAAPKFDKAKWVASLTPEQRSLLQLEIDTLHESWLALLKDELVTKEFLELKRFLDRETAAGKKWFPPKEDVYSWSRHTPFPTVKVVILGQDPYHNHNQAHGLAFSVRPPTPAPPSLKNMYIALKNDYPSFTPPPNRGGLLTPWADRGVLMLNTSLTVRAHEANSHSNRGWERFTQKVIDLVAARRTRGVVFMAWGTPAGKRVLKVDGKRHLVLKSVHPSPLSAARGFFTCGHFRMANEWLMERYGVEGKVDWALTEGASVFEEETKKEGVDGAKKKGEEEEEVEGEAVEGSVVRKVEAVVKASVLGANAGAKETVVEKKGAIGKAEDDENAAPEVQA